MTMDQIRDLPVPDLADADSHVWCWTNNRSLPQGFDLLSHWGYKYLAPIHWVKPSGFGAWFVHRTQTLLFGYKGKLDMLDGGRFKPNVIFANPRGGHSTKPPESVELIEAVSHEPRVELFAPSTRPGWTSLGDGIDGRDIVVAMKDLAGPGQVESV